MAVSTPDECWPWLGWVDEFGYGRFREHRGGRKVKSNRMAFFLCHGHWPVLALHLPVDCHNPACCNPLHIYEGTRQDNQDDSAADGTRHRPMLRSLTPAQERDIFTRYEAGGVLQRELADEYGVGRTTVTYIIRRLRNTPTRE